MLFHPPETRLQLADDNAVAGHGGMVLDDGAAQPDKLPAQICPEIDHIRSHVSAQRCHLRSEIRDISPGRHIPAHAARVCAHIADFCAHVAKQLEDKAFGLA